MEVISENQLTPRYAGFWLRFVAYIIDSFVISIASFVMLIPMIIGIVFSAISLEDVHNPQDFFQSGNWQSIGWIIGLALLAGIFSLIMQWLYYALMESSATGGTLGKMALGIKVVDYEGNRISFARASGRYFSKIITNMTLLIGYIIAGFTPKKQALHDIIASCIVIRK